ncbi:MAG: class II aldolase/adducin family protein [Chromatiales bacterium]|jgi:L-fuculose-phosphate aldolase
MGLTIREVRVELKQELLRYYRWLRQYGYNDSHSGNASVKDGERFWVTPTGCCADTLEVGGLIECPLSGGIPAGASLDAPLHQQIYQKNTAAKAVIHSHGPYSIAVTLNGLPFIPLDFEGQYYFSEIPVVDIPYADYLERAPAVVSEILRGYKIMVVRGHGVYANAENLNLAYKWTCSLELSAKISVIAANLGVSRVIP